MLRWLTCAVVVLLVACGGGGTGGGTPTPSLMSLFPVADLTEGTIYDYAVMKRVFRAGVQVSTKSRTSPIKIGHLIDPSGPDTHFAGFPGDTDPQSGAAFLWTARGLELAALSHMQFWGADGICVSVVSPGVLLAPNSFLPGAVHSCSLVGSPIDGFELTWVGPEAKPGHPDAQRFEWVSTAPYSQPNPAHPRFGATNIRTSVVLFCSPDIGPVQVSVTHTFFSSATIFEDVIYDITLTGITPGP